MLLWRSKVAASPGRYLGDTSILSRRSNQLLINPVPLVPEFIIVKTDRQATQLLLQPVDAEAHSGVLRRHLINSVHLEILLKDYEFFSDYKGGREPVRNGPSSFPQRSIRKLCLEGKEHLSLCCHSLETNLIFQCCCRLQRVFSISTTPHLETDPVEDGRSWWVRLSSLETDYSWNRERLLSKS